jgi:threonylcarbamoyladenosine tRNA methylthiotransferase MtaB
MKKEKTIALYTLGCRANQFDSESIFSQFSLRGYIRVPEFSNADVHIINTCTVTNSADSKSRQLIRKVVRSKGQGKVIITGCSVQLDARSMSVYGVDLIVDNANKPDLYLYFSENGDFRIVSSDIQKIKEIAHMPVQVFGGKARAHLKVQDGCNQRCSYCIIPAVRGNSRSLPQPQVIEQLQSLLNNGYSEIVVTGIHCGQYRYKRQRFPQLLASIMDFPGNFRVRLSSLEPTELNGPLLSLFNQYPDKLCRHVHVPIQSASNTILKRMHRPYGTDQLRRVFEGLSAIGQGANIGIDVITGFPGETDREFEDTLNFIKSQPISYGHVFPFSAKKSTPAALYARQIPKEEKTRRAALVRGILKIKQQEFLSSQFFTTARAVMESPTYGTTGNYLRVSLSKKGYKSGDIVAVKILDTITQSASEKFPVLTAEECLDSRLTSY